MSAYSFLLRANLTTFSPGLSTGTGWAWAASTSRKLGKSSSPTASPLATPEAPVISGVTPGPQACTQVLLSAPAPSPVPTAHGSSHSGCGSRTCPHPGHRLRSSHQQEQAPDPKTEPPTGPLHPRARDWLPHGRMAAAALPGSASHPCDDKTRRVNAPA